MLDTPPHQFRRPSLSIIIPTCDRPSQLLSAFRSCGIDSISGVELIIVDDGLTSPVDPTIFDCEVKILKTSGYLGAASARNLGAKSAKTDFLLFLDDDDCFINNYVSEVLEHIRVGTHRVGVCCTSRKSHAALISGYNYTSLSLPLKQCIFGAGMGLWIQKSLFMDLGGFSGDYRIDEDTHFFCKIRVANISVYVSSTVGVSISPNLAPVLEGKRLTALMDPALRRNAYRLTFMAFRCEKRLNYADKLFLLSRYIRATRKYYMHLLISRLKSLLSK